MYTVNGQIWKRSSASNLNFELEDYSPFFIIILYVTTKYKL